MSPLTQLCRKILFPFCITLPNPAIERRHETFGLEKVAHSAEVGFKFNRWLDVGYRQKIYRELRSPTYVENT